MIAAATTTATTTSTPIGTIRKRPADTPAKNYLPAKPEAKCFPVSGVRLDSLYHVKRLAKFFRIPASFFPDSIIKKIAGAKFVVLRELLPFLDSPEMRDKVRQLRERESVPGYKVVPHPEVWTESAILVSRERTAELIGTTHKRVAILVNRGLLEAVNLRSVSGASFVTVASIRGLLHNMGYGPAVPESSVAAPEGVDTSKGDLVAPGACACISAS